MTTQQMQIRLRQGAMSRIERGDVEPSAKLIAALMQNTGQSFEELFEVVDVGQ